MKWRLIIPYICENRYKEWIENISNTKGVTLLDHYCISCENPSESIMYFNLESSRLFFNAYKVFTKGYVEVDIFKDMPTLCPDRKKEGTCCYWPGFQEWFMMAMADKLNNS